MAKRKRTPPAKKTAGFPAWLWPISIVVVVLVGFFLWQSSISEPAADQPVVTATALLVEDQTSSSSTAIASSGESGSTSPEAIASPAATDRPTVAQAATVAVPNPTQTPILEDQSSPGPAPMITPTTPRGTITGTIEPSRSTAHPLPSRRSLTPTVSLPLTTSLPPPVYSYNVINVYPHDRNAYTQGLIFLDGIFYEGTGLHGRSTLRKVEVETGQALQLIDLPPELFGEGITIFGDSLFQLTWKARQGFEYDKDTFEMKRVFTYPTEGWGITHDGQRLIMSDGSAMLYFWDPETLEEIGRVQVTDDQGPVVRLNELEYIDGEVFANVWQTDWVARIDPDTGQVVGWIDLSGLLTAEDRTQPVDVLNGIAYDAEGDRLFVTGKFWPKVFEIELVEP